MKPLSIIFKILAFGLSVVIPTTKIVAQPTESGGLAIECYAYAAILEREIQASGNLGYYAQTGLLHEAVEATVDFKILAARPAAKLGRSLKDISYDVEQHYLETRGKITVEKWYRIFTLCRDDYFAILNSGQ